MKAKYAKVYEALVERISQMKPGDRLDSEVQLAEDFEVSPMTVRRALQLLSQEGRTVGIPGSGTYVTEKAVVVDGGAAELKHVDLGGVLVEPELKPFLVSASMDSATPAEQRFFEISNQEFVLRIIRGYRRTESHDGVVGAELVTVVSDCFPGALGGDLTGNILQTLANCAKSRSGPLVQETTICMGEEADALFLEILPPSAKGALRVERSLRTAGGGLCGTIQTVFAGSDIRLVLG